MSTEQSTEPAPVLSPNEIAKLATQRLSARLSLDPQEEAISCKIILEALTSMNAIRKQVIARRKLAKQARRANRQPKQATAQTTEQPTEVQPESEEGAVTPPTPKKVKKAGSPRSSREKS